jgi:hypothetical protein
MKKFILLSLLFVTAILLLPGQALASPLFSLDSADDWDTALGDGRIEPVLGLYPALTEHYGTEGVDFTYVTPELFVATAAESGQSDDGLVMHWGNDEVDLQQVAAWEYVYDLDPDLTGTLVNLTVMAPAGILSVSLTLNDSVGAGGWASWVWSLPPIVAGVPYSITIDPSIMLNQSGSTGFAQSVVPYDLTKTISIQADELSIAPGAAGAAWTVFPPVPVVGGTTPWNYWSAMSVTPEPATILLLGFGGLLLRRRKH